MHCRRWQKDHWTESNCIVFVAAGERCEMHVLCVRQIIFTAALYLTSPLSQKTGDLETQIGTSLLYLMKGKRLVEQRWIMKQNFDRGTRSDLGALIVIFCEKNVLYPIWLVSSCLQSMKEKLFSWWLRQFCGNHRILLNYTHIVGCRNHVRGRKCI